MRGVKSPSGWPWWSQCPAGPAMVEQLGLTSPSSPAAAEGSVAHILADSLLSGRVESLAAFRGTTYDHEGVLVSITPEMVEHVYGYMEFLSDMQGEALTEVKLSIGDWLQEPGVSGTADAVIVYPLTETVTIVDLKYGLNPVTDTGQLRIYALAFIKAIKDSEWENPTFCFRIYQPRINNHIAEYLTLEELESWATNVLTPAVNCVEDARRQIKPEHFNPHEATCKYCPAKAYCPALQQLVTHAVYDSPLSLTTQPYPNPLPLRTMDIHQLSHAAAAVPLIKQWCDAVMRRLEEEVIQNGREVPGFVKVLGREGNRQWDMGADHHVINTLGEAAREWKLISPTKAEKLASPDQWDALKPYVIRKPAEYVVKPRKS